MNTTRLLCALVLPVTVAAAHAEPCEEYGAPSLEWRACADNAVHAADAKLESYMQAAQSRAGETGKSLAAAQAAWSGYRTAHCGDVYLFWGSGQQRYRASLQCNLELTRERTHDIWAAYLTHSDSAPAVLPEP